MSNNTNEKIKIIEVDKTSGFSSTIDSTDIAFVPAFHSDSKKVEYTLKLYTDVETFKNENTQATVQDIDGHLSQYTDASEGVSDPGYDYAYQLLNLGLPVLYGLMPNMDVAYLYEKDSSPLDKLLEDLKDKGMYPVKYITSGGYPSVLATPSESEPGLLVEDTKYLAKKLIECATARGDAVALVDYQCDKYDSIEALRSDITITDSTDGEGIRDNSYATMFAPWMDVTVGTIDNKTTLRMPGSFHYLCSLARAIKRSPNYLAIAGVTRGAVLHVSNPDIKITNKAAEDCQPAVGTEDNDFSINCITEIRPYGQVIWGNRTLKNLETNTGPKATHFLNTRNMLSDIKKVMRSTATALMFEQNTDTLWLRFKSGITPLLNELKTGGALANYQIIKTKVSPSEKGKFKATVKIQPMYAVEFFELTVEIHDEDAAVTE